MQQRVRSPEGFEEALHRKSHGEGESMSLILKIVTSYTLTAVSLSEIAS